MRPSGQDMREAGHPIRALPCCDWHSPTEESWLPVLTDLPAFHCQTATTSLFSIRPGPRWAAVTVQRPFKPSLHLWRTPYGFHSTFTLVEHRTPLSQWKIYNVQNSFYFESLDAFCFLLYCFCWGKNTCCIFGWNMTIRSSQCLSVHLMALYDHWSIGT